jgi:hypothetical protein
MYGFFVTPCGPVQRKILWKGQTMIFENLELKVKNVSIGSTFGKTNFIHCS